jgi:hypothetical protein
MLRWIAVPVRWMPRLLFGGQGGKGSARRPGVARKRQKRRASVCVPAAYRAGSARRAQAHSRIHYTNLTSAGGRWTGPGGGRRAPRRLDPPVRAGRRGGDAGEIADPCQARGGRPSSPDGAWKRAPSAREGCAPARRSLCAVGDRRIVACGARSPTRNAAEGHAPIRRWTPFLRREPSAHLETGWRGALSWSVPRLRTP